MEKKVAEYTTNNIKVTIHVNDNVSESVKVSRINQIYDVLTESNDDELNDDDKSKKKLA